MDATILLYEDDFRALNTMLVVRTELQAREALRKSIANIRAELRIDHAPSFRQSENVVSEHLNIQVQIGQHPLAGGDGYYTAGPPPTIFIDTSQTSPERCNFTYYHEITHHLIRHSDALYSFIHEYARDDFERVLEKYCNVGAAEFLVPLGAIRDYIRQNGFSIELIRNLDDLFPASKPAIAIQLAQAAVHKCIILVCGYGVIPLYHSRQQVLLDSRTQDCLHIQYSSSSPTCNYSCGRYVVIPKTHLIYGAFEGGQYQRGRDKTLFKSGRNFPVHCEAFSYRNQVFSEFRFSDPISSNQMTLF